MPAVQIMQILRDRFELVRGGSSANLAAMEGTRGFAVALVFLVHYTTMVHPWVTPGSMLEAFGDSLHILGSAGVDLFFILSGYLIYGSLISREQAFTPFIKRRIRRIYPAFLVVFVIYVALSFASPADNRIPAGSWPATLYLVQNLLLLPGLQGVQPMIVVSWSLGFEMLFYLVIPVVISTLQLRARGMAARLAVFALLFAAIMAYSIFAARPTFAGSHIRMIMFVAGMLLFEALRSPRAYPAGTVLGTLGLVLGCMATQLPIAGAGAAQWKAVIMFAAFFVFCYSCYSNPGGPLARLFSWTPLRWLGNMSYSFYLLHSITIKACLLVWSKVLPPDSHHYADWMFWAALPPVFGAALLTSAALFLTIERPYSLAFAHQRKGKANDAPAALPSGR